jgi:O-antigen ligase
MSIDIIRDNIVFGTGPGQFKNFMYKHIPVMLGSWEESQIAWIYKNAGLGESHNFFLFRTAELGIFGFVGALCLPFMFITLSYRV